MKPPMPEQEPEKICRTCQNWQHDQVGCPETGMGICLLNINPTQLKWPGIPACKKFEAKQ
ncbi:MAG: hypothetical protein WC856_13820 [Methylococcaceae bacterium]|jgi:hypothetical protein